MKFKDYINEKMDESIIPKKIAHWVTSKITDKKVLLKMSTAFANAYNEKTMTGKSGDIEKHLRSMIDSGKIKNGKEFAEYVIKKYKK
jgi:thymidine phosphorylase